jgi:hypothetical protein
LIKNKNLHFFLSILSSAWKAAKMRNKIGLLQTEPVDESDENFPRIFMLFRKISMEWFV